MTSTGQRPAKAEQDDKPAKHVHHGRTLAAWVGTTIALVAFILGGIAVIIQNWPLFWISAGLLVLGMIATKVLQVMGYGAD
ncbi:MAG TPA: HGxxPAAW family protein [Propionibacteriaceae bacterium]|nr:HGxxPAAW family protein [Propionibacteriaceae bacterium]